MNEFKIKNGLVVSGSADIEQNLTVRGTLTADQYNVSIVSTSILYESGSTKFGNSLDDLHTFTGSLQLTGSINLNGQVIGTGKLDETTFNSYTSSISSSIGGLSSSIATTTSGLTSTITSLSSSLTSSIGSLSSSVATTTNTLSSSLSSSIDYLSSSVATTTLNLKNRVDSIETSTGSLNTFTSSINTTIKSKLDNESVISGSIQVELSGTTGYSTFSSSISSSIGLLSSSVATITSGLTSTITSLSSSLSGSIDSLSSSVASINNTQNGRLDSLETASGSIRTNFNTFTSSYNTGSFTGSFKGDGGQLYNIPSSGITGLSLFQIASGSVSASISPDNGFRVNTDVYIDGTLTAKEIHTDYVTSSVLYQSGSTKFGDTSDDNHLFTGSVLVNGNVSATSITGSINFNNLTNVPTLVSGSSQIIYSGLTGIPSDIVSGSSQLTGSYDTRYVLSGSITQTTWDNIASKPNDIVSSSNQISAFGFLQTSSFNTYTSSNNGRVSSLESKTGSYATTGSNSFIGTENVTGSLIVSSSLKVIGTQNINGNLSVTGSVVISGSLDLSNANVDNSRYLHTQSTSGTTWNIVHNLNYLYPSITVYDASNKVMLPDEITSIDANTTQVTFAVAESGHALASVGGISTSTADRYLHTQTSATGSWVIDHNIGYKYVTINVYDGSDEQLIPQKITAVSVNRTQIDFATPTTGNAIITVGGPRTTSLFVQTGSFYNTTTNIGITGSLVVTGDVDGNSFNTTSDKKLKTNLVRIENALDKIEKLNGYTFDWIEEYSEDRTRQIGMVADEVYEVQPELISHRDIVLLNKEEKIKLLDYSKVTAILIEAIKELNDKVTKLENKKKKK